MRSTSESDMESFACMAFPMRLAASSFGEPAAMVSEKPWLKHSISFSSASPSSTAIIGTDENDEYVRIMSVAAYPSLRASPSSIRTAAMLL